MEFSWQTFSVATAGWAAAFAFVILFYRGKVVPRDSLNDVIHDRDEWRAESRIKDAQIAEKDQQLRHLAEVGEVQKHLLTSIGQLTGQEQR